VAYVKNAGNAPVNHAKFRATILSSSGQQEAVSDPQDFSILAGVTSPVVWKSQDVTGDRPADELDGERRHQR
jgi:hypothetical protein